MARKRYSIRFTFWGHVLEKLEADVNAATHNGSKREYNGIFSLHDITPSGDK